MVKGKVILWQKNEYIFVHRASGRKKYIHDVWQLLFWVKRIFYKYSGAE